MSELDERESEFARLLSRASFDESPRSEHRDALREQALARFELAGVTPPSAHWKSALNQGRRLMRRPIVRFSFLAAACLVVAVVWLLVPGQQPTAEAFHKFARAIVEAKTAKFETEVTVEGQPKQQFETYYLPPGRFRQELAGDMVNIADLKARKMMGLNPAMKMATVMNIKGLPENAESLDLFQRTRELLASRLKEKESQYERLGEKEIDGRRAIGFRFDSPLATMTLWGDPDTGQPLLIQNVYNGVPRTETIMKDFELNVDLEASLFDLTPPADYKILSLDVDASPPTDADLLSALRTTSDVAGGKFPDTLDTAGIQKAMISYMTKQKEQKQDNSDEQTKQLMQKSISIGRGVNFVLQLPESADAHYAGKGVMREAGDTPIFWYKPEGKEKYQVIYADLSTREVDRAPQVPGAVRIEKAGQPAPPDRKPARK